MDTLQIHVAVALGVTAVAAGFDIASRNIPNPITFGGILAGFALNTWSGFGLAGASGAARALAVSALGVFLSAFIPLVFFIRGEMGGGDVKLMAAIGAIVGPLLGFQVLGGAYACLLLFLPYRLFAGGRAAPFMAHVRGHWRNLTLARAERVPVVPFKMPATIMGPSIFLGFVWCAWRNWSFL
jgi:prepilin peptidase CpaA